MTLIKNIPTNKSDADLMNSYQSTGDMEELSLLFQRYMDLVYGICLKYLKNNEDAKDAVINIFEELIIKVKKHKIDYFRAWLYQLTKNHCLMILRKKKIYHIQIDGEFVQFADDSHPEEAKIKENQLTIMQFCINQLVEQQKVAVELFYLKSKCYQEISAITNTELKLVKSYIQNGRRNLKICMDKEIKQNS
ncbi:MAG: sigma-70 family RNA polymerase sigma factor [Bacteroidota bacterium]